MTVLASFPSLPELASASQHWFRERVFQVSGTFWNTICRLEFSLQLSVLPLVGFDIFPFIHGIPIRVRVSSWYPCFDRCNRIRRIPGFLLLSVSGCCKSLTGVVPFVLATDDKTNYFVALSKFSHLVRLFRQRLVVHTHIRRWLMAGIPGDLSACSVNRIKPTDSLITCTLCSSFIHL